MAIIDGTNYFTTPDSPFAPTAAQDNLAPLSIDTAPLALPSGSGGAAATGYNAGSSANAGRDLGIGGEMWLEVLVTTAVAQSANTTTFYLATDAAATLASFVSSTGVGVLLASPNFTAAQLAVKSYWRAQLPASGSYLRYLGLSVTINTTVWTAGAVEAKLITNVQQSDLYLSGIAIS